MLKYLSIHPTFADINNVEYNINIETYHLTGTNIMFFIQIKDNIWRIYWLSYYFCHISLTAKPEMPYLFTFREILNLAIEFGRSLPRKHLIPRYFNIDRYARQKYGLISMCILSFDTSTSIQTFTRNSKPITLPLSILRKRVKCLTGKPGDHNRTLMSRYLKSKATGKLSEEWDHI